MNRTETQEANLAQQIANARAGIFLGGGIKAYEEGNNHKKGLPTSHKPIGNPTVRKKAEKERKRILRFLKKGPMTQNQLIAKTEQPMAATRSRISWLRDEGSIISKGKLVAAILWGLVE